jgi:hypothetical protein
MGFVVIFEGGGQARIGIRFIYWDNGQKYKEIINLS